MNPLELDQQHIRRVIEVAHSARVNGNHPFGALLVGPEGKILLEAESTIVTDNDITGHAESNLIRMAWKKYDPEFLATCTVYASTEPCPMCAGAIFWSNVRRVVFGLSEEGLYGMAAEGNEEELMLSPREVFARGKKDIEVVGPILEEEATKVHEGFWDNP